MHFSQVCVFLNTDFGRSGSGRGFGRKKLLRSKNRIELLTPPAALRFLCSLFTFCISVSSLTRKLCSEEKKNMTVLFVQMQSHHFDRATDSFKGTVNSFTGRLMLTKASLLASNGLLLQNKAEE